MKKIINKIFLTTLVATSIFLPTGIVIKNSVVNSLNDKQTRTLNLPSSKVQATTLPTSWSINENFGVSLYTLYANIFQSFIQTDSTAFSFLNDPAKSPTDKTAFEVTVNKLMQGWGTNNLSLLNYLVNNGINVSTNDFKIVQSSTPNLGSPSEINIIDSTVPTKMIWAAPAPNENAMNYSIAHTIINGIFLSTLQYIESEIAADSNFPRFDKYYVQMFANVVTFLFNGTFSADRPTTEMFNECQSPEGQASDLTKTQLTCSNELFGLDGNGNQVLFNSQKIFFVTDFIQDFLFNIVKKGSQNTPMSANESAQILTNLVGTFLGSFKVLGMKEAPNNPDVLTPSQASTQNLFLINQNSVDLSKVDLTTTKHLHNLLSTSLSNGYKFTGSKNSDVALSSPDNTSGHMNDYVNKFIAWIYTVDNPYDPMSRISKLENFIGNNLILPTNTIPDALSSIIISQSYSNYNPNKFYLTPRILTRLNPNSSAKKFLSSEISNDANLVSLSYREKDSDIGAHFSLFLKTIDKFNTGSFDEVNVGFILSVVFGSLAGAAVLAYIIFAVRRHFKYEYMWKKRNSEQE
ncbi:MAG: hypothetical protein ACRAS9_01415 [Mycoplasma sp.]